MSTPRKINTSTSRSEETHVHVRGPGGFWASMTGGPTAVIAIVAVIGLVLVCIYVIDLAKHAVERPSGGTPAPSIAP